MRTAHFCAFKRSGFSSAALMPQFGGDRRRHRGFVQIPAEKGIHLDGNCRRVRQGLMVIYRQYAHPFGMGRQYLPHAVELAPVGDRQLPFRQFPSLPSQALQHGLLRGHDFAQGPLHENDSIIRSRWQPGQQLRDDLDRLAFGLLQPGVVLTDFLGCLEFVIAACALGLW